jgi:hypothetical protein
MRVEVDAQWEREDDFPDGTGRREGVAMKSTGLAKVGAVCAVVTVVGFIVGIAVMATGGVQVLIPETGADGLDFLASFGTALLLRRPAAA